MDRADYRKSSIQISLSDQDKTAISHLPPKKKMFCRPYKKASFSVFRGSLTVEAALAVPLFFFCVITLVSMLEMYGIYVRELTVLQQKAEKEGIYLAAVQSDAVTEIDLRTQVPFQIRGIPLFQRTVRISVRARVRPWTGRRASDNGGQEEEGDHLVYVTDYHSVYHTSSRCTHLNLKVSSVSARGLAWKRNSYGARYHACEKCVGKGGKNAIVYITPDGDCYHNSSECSGLKRSTHLVPESEVKNLRKCSRCQALEAG